MERFEIGGIDEVAHVHTIYLESPVLYGVSAFIRIESFLVGAFI